MSWRRRLALSSIGLALLFGASATAEAFTRPYTAPYDVKQYQDWPEIALAVGVAWYQNDIEGLEKQLSSEPDAYTADGMLKHGLAYRTVAYIIFTSTSEHPSQTERWRFLESWQAKFPDSAAPDIIRSMMLLEYAYRTPDSTIPPRFPAPGFLPSNSSLNEATAALKRAKSRTRVPPVWYNAAINVEIAKHSPFEVLFEIADEARASSPQDLQPQFTLLNHLIIDLHWHPTNVETLVRTFADDGKGNVDVARYAQFYLEAFTTHYGITLVRESNVKWTYMRDGLHALSEKMPTDRLGHQRAATACLAGDLTEAKLAFQELKGAAMPSVWRLPKFYEDCRDWVAHQGQP